LNKLNSQKVYEDLKKKTVLYTEYVAGIDDWPYSIESKIIIFGKLQIKIRLWNAWIYKLESIFNSSIELTSFVNIYSLIFCI
jgi:hypothetical protein